MASTSSAPQLSPVREFAPLDMNVHSSYDSDIETTARKLRDTKITDEVEETLESGAPLSAAEASLGSPAVSPVGSNVSSPSPSRPLSRVRQTPKKLALESVQEHASSESDSETERFAAALRGGGGATSAGGKREDDEDTEVVNKGETVDKTTEPTEIPPAIQSALDKEKEFLDAVDLVEPKVVHAPETVNKEDSSLLVSCEARAHHGMVEKGGITAKVQSLAAKNERASEST